MSAHEAGRGAVRIGELSRRVGVTPEVLRAWERRYGILSPTRTEGGFRLYGEDDERRIRRMLENLEQGLSAAEAARLARAESPSQPDPVAGTADGSGPPTAVALGEQLRRALDGFDDVGAHSVLDRLLGSYPLESVLRDAVLPYLHELGERWAHAEASVAQEHFASALLRGRLLALARDWGRGRGPHALLACVPGDQHDVGLICFGLALRAHGWRITYLGADTPLRTLLETAESAAACPRRRQRRATRAGSKRSRRPARARLRNPSRARRRWNRCEHRRDHRCSMARRRSCRSRGKHHCTPGRRDPHR